MIATAQHAGRGRTALMPVPGAALSPCPALPPRRRKRRRATRPHGGGVIVAGEGRVGDDRTVFMSVPPATLPLVLRCPDEDTSVDAQPDHPAAP